MILLTPGPCPTSESVRQAAAGPDLNHREPAYLDLIREVRERLRAVYPGFKDWTPYLLGGSGTAAMEAMATSCVVRGPVLIVANGYYSERMDAIFRVHDIPTETLRFDWMSAWDLQQVEAHLASGRFEAVVGTHHETTTGRLNDVAGLAALARQYGVRCFTDAMSSFGADPLDATHLSGLCASGNKCLHALPGVGFVLLRPEAVEAMDAAPRRTYYLSLPQYGGEDPPLTPPVPMLAALRQALREMGEGGAAARDRVYRARQRRLAEALTERGLRLALPLEVLSSSMLLIETPEGWDADGWFAANLEAGFVIYRCKGELRERCFQISTMGEQPEENYDRWIEAVGRLQRRR